MHEKFTPPVSGSAAVENVLAGRTADGLQPFAMSIPFTKDSAVREAVAAAVSIIYLMKQADLRRRLTPLTAKLLIHCSRSGIQTIEKIRAFLDADFMDLKDAIHQRPDILDTKAGVKAIVRAYRQRTRQAAAALCADLPAEVPPRNVLWQSGDYRIEEATDPRHLQHDSTALGHCAGTLHNTVILRLLGIEPNAPEAIHYLRYWMAIKSRTARILTLTAKHLPLITMEYRTRSRVVAQIAKPGELSPTAHYFRPLCAALSALRHDLPISAIPSLPPGGESRANTILTPFGTLEPPTVANIKHAISGVVKLQPQQTRFNALACLNPMLDIDIDDLLPHDRVRIRIVAGTLHSATPHATLPNLIHVGRNLDLHGALSCDAPRLTTVGGKISASSMRKAFLPSLVSVEETFECPSLELADLSNLQSVGRKTENAAAIKTQCHRADRVYSLKGD